jgi:hypothetical protein
MTNSYELWRGRSALDGKPIVLLASGFGTGSKNRKTGAMIQTWIMRQDVAPHEAARNGEDASVCGDCPLRMDSDGHRGCYVLVHQGPLSVWKSWKRGNVPRLRQARWRKVIGGRQVRMGSYGDPAAVPLDVWNLLRSVTSGWTGYTHQWRELGPAWFEFLMASTSVEDDAEAVDAGWRTFKVVPVGGRIWPSTEVQCPATTRGTQCADCGLCMGQSKQAKCVTIEAHGNGKRWVA